MSSVSISGDSIRSRIQNTNLSPLSSHPQDLATITGNFLFPDSFQFTDVHLGHFLGKCGVLALHWCWQFLLFPCCARIGGYSPEGVYHYTDLIIIFSQDKLRLNLRFINKFKGQGRTNKTGS